MKTGQFVGIPSAVPVLVGALILPLWFGASSCAQESGGKIKTLMVLGGEIHDFAGIGNVLEKEMKKTGKYDITRVDKDLDAFLADRVRGYDLVVFYWTLGKISDAQKKGIMDHVAGGKGFVTLHSGADSFRGDKDWHNFVGGHFVTHPQYRPYRVTITDVKHPITKGIEDFTITGEQYILEYEPTITVLANGPWKGKEMPAIWVKPHGQGRVFYTGIGHDPKAVKQPMFQKIFLRGCLWAAGRPVTD